MRYLFQSSVVHDDSDLSIIVAAQRVHRRRNHAPAMTPAISSQEPGFAESIQDVGIRRRLHAPQSSEQAARRHASLQVPTEFKAYKGQSQRSAEKD